MSESEAKKDIKIVPVLRVFTRASFAHPYALGILILSVITVQISNLVAPLFLRQFINGMTGHTPSSALLPGLLLILAGYTVVSFVSWLARRVQMGSTTKLEVGVMSNLTNSAYAYMADHSYEFFVDNFVGTLTRRVTRYARAYEPVVDNIITSIFPTILYAGGVIVVLSLSNLWLGLGLLIWCVVFVTLQFFMTKWRYGYKILRSQAESRLTGALSDSIGNHSSIIAFGAQKQEVSIVAQVVKEWRAATVHSWDADSASFAVQGFLSLLVQTGVLVGGVVLWTRGVITIGDVVLIQIYIVSLTQSIVYIGSSIRQLFDAFADAYEMIEILETPHAVQDRVDAKSYKVGQGEITFDAVDFSFGGSRNVLENFFLTIPSGQKTALVGPSGAGKSTVTKLLLRLYDVTGGAIRIDGTDIRDMTQVSLRQAIGFVPQEPVLFHRSLRDNIKFGKLDATDEEVIEAAKQAHCHEFISQLPDNYATTVGERGVKLSGGERQRIAIARAILKDAPILVLDEATSALDSESEHLIQDALATLMRGKTVIVIAHRLSTVMKMDRIVVIEGGAIVSDGTHDELLSEESNLYKKLWEIQAGGFLTSEDE